jgi:tetratricopeptide (TPR) repeat protein
MRPDTLATICFWLAATALSAQSTYHEQLRNGDKAYLRDQYQRAEEHYRKAADSQYADPKAVYNLGNALYQQGKWEDASKRYEQAAQGMSQAAEKADALHNLGNAWMKQHAFDKAVKAYEESLRNRPADPETKQNLQMAKKKLAEQQREQQQKQQQNDQQQGQQGQEPDQPQPKPNEAQQQAPSPSRQNAPQNPPPSPKSAEEQQKLKTEEARQFLETAVGEEDKKNAKKYRSHQRPDQTRKHKKDW